MTFSNGIFIFPMTEAIEARLSMQGWRAEGDSWITGNPALVPSYLEYADISCNDAIKTYLAKRASDIAASSATDSNIVIPVPNSVELKGFQKAGVAYILPRKNTLVADACRLGKSAQCIATANVVEPKSVVIFCPANAKEGWKREWKKWSTQTHLKVGIATAAAYPKTDVVIINYDITLKHKEKLLKGFDLVIVDECHKVKNEKAQRTKVIIGNNTKKWPGIPYKKRIFVSATPATCRPRDLWVVCKACDPKGLGSSKENFQNRYCEAFVGKWGLDDSGASNVKELQYKMRASFMVARSRADVMADDLPPHRQTVILSGDGLTDILASEANAITTGLAAYASVLGHKEIANLQLIPHEALSLASVAMITEFVESLLEDEPKVVIFAHHRSVVKAYSEALKDYGVVTLSGATSASQKQLNIDAFREDPEVRIFIGNYVAAGTAISLAASNVVVCAELVYVPGDITQAEERIYLMGKEDQGTIYYPVVADSFSERLANLLVDRSDTLDQLTLIKRLNGSN